MEIKDKINLLLKYTKNLNDVHFEIFRNSGNPCIKIQTEFFQYLLDDGISPSEFELLCKKEIIVFITKLDTLKSMLERSL